MRAGEPPFGDTGRLLNENGRPFLSLFFRGIWKWSRGASSAGLCCAAGDAVFLRRPVDSSSGASASLAACSPSWLDETATGNKCLGTSQLSAEASAPTAASPLLPSAFSIIDVQWRFFGRRTSRSPNPRFFIFLRGRCLWLAAAFPTVFPQPASAILLLWRIPASSPSDSHRRPTERRCIYNLPLVQSGAAAPPAGCSRYRFNRRPPPPKTSQLWVSNSNKKYTYKFDVRVILIQYYYEHFRNFRNHYEMIRRGYTERTTFRLTKMDKTKKCVTANYEGLELI